MVGCSFIDILFLALVMAKTTIQKEIKANKTIQEILLRKWYKRWGVDDLLELSGDAIHYLMIEERLVESLRIKWEDAKRTKLEYYIANVNPECWSQYKARMPIDHIQPYLITNMCFNV